MNRDKVINIQTKYQHLCLTDWPFRIVPDEEFCTFLADRSDIRLEIDKLLYKLENKTISSMHLLFAWYGCGKTHTLRYIEYLCKRNFGERILPIYIEFPKSIKGFLDLYSSFMRQLDMEILRKKYVEIFSDSELKEEAIKIFSTTYPAMMNALALLYMGNKSQQETVITWLRRELFDLRILKSCGIMKAVNDSEDALNIMASLTRFIGMNPSQKRILWMIDEFQRIEDYKENIRQDIYSCLTSVFNRCPHHLTIILSSSTESLEIPKEISDRIGMEKIIALPPLSEEEAIEFVQDLLSKFRPSDIDSVQNSFFPFTESSVKEILKIIREKGGQLKPRTVMQAFNVVLDDAEFLIKKGDIAAVESEFVQNALKDREILDKSTLEAG